MKTKEEIKYFIEDSGYIFISEYLNSKSVRRVIIQDSVGYKYDIRLDNIKSKNNKRPIVGKNNPFTLENISLWLKLNNSHFEMLEDNSYNGSQSKIMMFCNDCKDYPETSWSNILNEKGCGICKGKQVGLYHNLETQRPDIATEWHPTKNRDLTPKDFTYSSNKKVWWLCPEGHEYYSSIASRTTNNTGCKMCYSNQIVKKNNLFEKYPEISSEWNYVKNKNLIPSEVSYGSSKKVWWICLKCKNEWKSSIANRTVSNTGCPKCSCSSKGEKNIRRFLYENKIEFITHFPLKNCKYKGQLFIDFYIDKYNLAIEYDGEQHFFPVDFAGKGKDWAKKEFKKTKKRDNIKTKYCKDNNISLLRISYWEFDNISNILLKVLLI